MFGMKPLEYLKTMTSAIKRFQVRKLLKIYGQEDGVHYDAYNQE